MNLTQKLGTGVALLALAGSLSACGAAPQDALSSGVPSFEADADWPKLPAHWIIGPGTGIYVDSRDHVWLLHRPERVSPEEFAAAQNPDIPECCVIAPPLIEVDPEGNVVQYWGSTSPAADWPEMPHGVFVDHNDNVWVATSIFHQVMKYTRDGKHLLTIGQYDKVGGSNDATLLGGSADIYVDPATNELYVADGYDNRRIIVYNAETGEYVRHWGAYGNTPDDAYQHPRTGEAGPNPQFNLIHGVAGSNDGLIYAADRTNSRVQVFTRTGEFLKEGSPRPGAGAAFDVAFSNDPGQRFLYVADGSQHLIHVLRRDDLSMLYSFGGEGKGPGQFGRPHNMAADSKGNIFVAEADPGRRFQRFAYKGLADPTTIVSAPIQPPTPPAGQQ